MVKEAQQTWLGLSKGGDHLWRAVVSAVLALVPAPRVVVTDEMVEKALRAQQQWTPELSVTTSLEHKRRDITEKQPIGGFGMAGIRHSKPQRTRSNLKSCAPPSTPH